MEFACNLNVSDARVVSVDYVSEVCGWQLYIDTRYACPNQLPYSSSSSSSSSTGPIVRPCANAQVDVYPLSYQTDLAYMSDNALYILHPCLYVYFAECEGASLCLVSGAGNVTRLVDYQSWLPSSNFQLTTMGDVPLQGFTSSYTYADNSTCSLNPDKHGQSVTVQFICDPFAVTARLTYVALDWLACKHTAYVNSSYACPISNSTFPSSSSSSASFYPSSSSSSSSWPFTPTSCADPQTNLSTLAFHSDLALYDATLQSTLLFHPCHPIVANNSCHDSTLCLLHGNGTAEILVGFESYWMSASYGLATHVLANDEYYSYYKIVDSEQCWYEGLSWPRQALVMFYCNESLVDGAELISVALQDQKPFIPCQWVVTLHTALACPQAPLSHSSSGAFELQPSCVHENVNLSTLAVGDPLVYAPPDGSNNYLLLRPCGSLIACVDGASCVNATLASINGTSNSSLLAYDAAWPSSSYQLVQLSGGPMGYQYTYVDQQQTCTYGGMEVQAQLVTRFFCSSELSQSVVAAVFTSGAPCVWYADVNTPLACSPPASPPTPLDKDLLAAFAVVAGSALLLVILLIAYRVRARKLLPYSGAVAMHSPSLGAQPVPEGEYVRIV